MPEKWIQSIDVKEGALIAYVKRRYGKDGFTDRGTIKLQILHDLSRDPNVTSTTRKRAHLAITYRKFKH